MENGLPPDVDLEACLLDHLGKWGPVRQGIIFCLALEQLTIWDLTCKLGRSERVIGTTISRLVHQGWVMRAGKRKCPSSGHQRTVFRLREGLQRALRLRTTLRPWLRALSQDKRAFWWESNVCFGWVWHPTLWLRIRAHYGDFACLADKARQANEEHPSTVLVGTHPCESFGFRREHRGQSLLAWATAADLKWVC